MFVFVLVDGLIACADSKSAHNRLLWSCFLKVVSPLCPQSCFSFSLILLVRVSKYRAGIPLKQKNCCNCRWRSVDGWEMAASSAWFYPTAYWFLPECWSGHFPFASYLFDYILRSMSLTHHTWRQVQALVSVSPPRCLENLTFLQKKKCTHPVLIRPGEKRGLWQRLSYGSPTHKLSLTETRMHAGRQAGMLQRCIWPSFLAFDDTV